MESVSETSKPYITVGNNLEENSEQIEPDNSKRADADSAFLNIMLGLASFAGFIVVCTILLWVSFAFISLISDFSNPGILKAFSFAGLSLWFYLIICFGLSIIVFSFSSSNSFAARSILIGLIYAVVALVVRVCTIEALGIDPTILLIIAAIFWIVFSVFFRSKNSAVRESEQ